MANELEDLQELLNKIVESDDFVDRAETYFKEHHENWSPTVAAYFQDFIARKKDQIHYEWYRVHQMGKAIASERANSLMADNHFFEE